MGGGRVRGLLSFVVYIVKKKLCKPHILSRRGGKRNRSDAVLPHLSDPEAGSDHGEVIPFDLCPPTTIKSRPAY